MVVTVSLGFMIYTFIRQYKVSKKRLIDIVNS